MISRAGTIGAHMSMAGIGVVHRDSYSFGSSPPGSSRTDQPHGERRADEAQVALRERDLDARFLEHGVDLHARSVAARSAATCRSVGPAAQLEVSALSPKPVKNATGAGMRDHQRVR